MILFIGKVGVISVSYTHLDVYKRQDFMFRFLKALGFADMPITIRSLLCVPAALLHAKKVTRSLLVLKPGALSSFLEARLWKCLKI